MDENLNVVNATQEDVVDSQNQEVNNQTIEQSAETNNNVDGVHEEAAPSPQSAEQNRAFAELRRKAEQAEAELHQRDEWIKNTLSAYGVNSWDEYTQKMGEQLQAQREQELRNQGYDPNAIREIMKNDPEFQSIVEQNKNLQQQINTFQENQKLLTEFSQLQKDFPEVTKPEDIPAEAWAKVDKGYSLSDAYFLANKDKFMQKTERETIQKLQSNAQKATGALGTEASDNKTSIQNMSKKDFSDLVEKVKRGEKINL